MIQSQVYTLLDKLVSAPPRFWTSRVIKKQWPKGAGLSDLVMTKPDPRVVGVKVYSVHLQHMALQSGYLTNRNQASVERNFIDAIQTVWETRFETEIWKTLTRRPVVKWWDFVYTFNMKRTNYTPRKSLFGRRVYPFKVGADDRKVLNPNYDRCPIQYIHFQPDTVHFAFPDPKMWFGDLTWISRPMLGGGWESFYRIVMTSATQPIRPDLGAAITVLPPGLRGWLYKWIWKILGIIP